MWLLELLYFIPGDGMPQDEIKRREEVTNALAREGVNVSVEEILNRFTAVGIQAKVSK